MPFWASIRYMPPAKPQVVRRDIFDSQPEETRNSITTWLYRGRAGKFQTRPSARDGSSIDMLYSKVLGELLSETQDEILDRLKGGGTIRVLDAGAGMGHGVLEARDMGKQVRAFGLSLNQPDTTAFDKRFRTNRAHIPPANRPMLLHLNSRTIGFWAS